MNVFISLLIYVLIYILTTTIAGMTRGINTIIVQIIGVIAAFIRIVIDLYNIRKNRKSKININPQRQLISHHIIIDRYEAFKKILSGLCSHYKVIEINGGSGIGKTYFLQILADLVNNKIESKVIQKKQLLLLQKKVHDYKAFYIDAENIAEFRDVIDNISRIYFRVEDTNIRNEQFATCIKRQFKTKKLLLIFDNINNRSLHVELNNFLNTYFNIRSQDTVIIGTNISLNYQHTNIAITLKPFQDDEIREFYDAYHRKLPQNMDEVIKHTMGLPLYIKYYLMNGNSPITNIDDMIKEHFNECNDNEKVLLLTILYSSLTNNHIEYRELQRFPFDNLDTNLKILKSRSLIIQENFQYKIHDQIAKIILNEVHLYAFYEPLSDQVLNILLQHIPSCSNMSTLIFYQLLLHNNKPTTALLFNDEDIIAFFKEQFNSEHYSFILNIGKFLFQHSEIADPISSRLSNKLMPQLQKYYILSLLNIGDYNEANFQIGEYRTRYNIGRIDNIDTYAKYEFYYMEADALHLQCHYIDAISQFNFLLSVASNGIFSNYYTKTFYQIAHCERHRGNLMIAREYYEGAKAKAIITEDCEYEILGQIGIISIDILIGEEHFDYRNIFETLLGKCRNEKVSNSVLAYIHKYCGRYFLRCKEYNSSQEHYEIADQMYRNCSSRKSKYLLFDWAEFYRAKKDFQKAIDLYDQCIVFGKNNNDANLINYAMFGKLIIKADQLSPEKFAEACAFIIQKSEQVNNEILCLQAKLIRSYYLNEISEHQSELFTMYRNKNLLREISLLQKMQKGEFYINDVHLNLV